MITKRIRKSAAEELERPVPAEADRQATAGKATPPPPLKWQRNDFPSPWQHQLSHSTARPDAALLLLCSLRPPSSSLPLWRRAASPENQSNSASEAARLHCSPACVRPDPGSRNRKGRKRRTKSRVE